MTYEVKDSILVFFSDDAKTTFGKIRNVNDQFMLLNPVIEETGEVIVKINIIFYSYKPTNLYLHQELLKDFQAYSRWVVHAYGRDIELTVGPGGEEYDHSSILEEGYQYFLLIDNKKFKIMTIYHDRMKVLGIGRHAYSEIQLLKD